jgi:hypothetical protein
MVFCFFTGGCSAPDGLNAIDAVRPLLFTGEQANCPCPDRSASISQCPCTLYCRVAPILKEHCGLRLGKKLRSFDCRLEDATAGSRERDQGVGLQRGSHYLRNVGFRGYAILTSMS